MLNVTAGYGRFSNSIAFCGNFILWFSRDPEAPLMGHPEDKSLEINTVSQNRLK